MKQRPGDFLVEELPAYEPSGSGEHVYLGIEKRGLGTIEAVRAIARALGVDPAAIGSAGLKDAQGITRQTLSVQGVDEARVRSLDLPGIAVLWVSRHGNK